MNPLTAAVVGGVVGAAGAAAAATLMDKRKRGELEKNVKGAIQHGSEIVGQIQRNKGSQTRKHTQARTSRGSEKKA